MPIIRTHDIDPRLAAWLTFNQGFLDQKLANKLAGQAQQFQADMQGAQMVNQAATGIVNRQFENQQNRERAQDRLDYLNRQFELQSGLEQKRFENEKEAFKIKQTGASDDDLYSDVMDSSRRRAQSSDALDSAAAQALFKQGGAMFGGMNPVTAAEQAALQQKQKDGELQKIIQEQDAGFVFDYDEDDKANIMQLNAMRARAEADDTITDDQRAQALEEINRRRARIFKKARPNNQPPPVSSPEWQAANVAPLQINGQTVPGKLVYRGPKGEVKFEDVEGPEGVQLGVQGVQKHMNRILQNDMQLFGPGNIPQEKISQAQEQAIAAVKAERDLQFDLTTKKLDDGTLIDMSDPGNWQTLTTTGTKKGGSKDKTRAEQLGFDDRRATEVARARYEKENPEDVDGFDSLPPAEQANRVEAVIDEVNSTGRKQAMSQADMEIAADALDDAKIMHYQWSDGGRSKIEALAQTDPVKASVLLREDIGKLTARLRTMSTNDGKLPEFAFRYRNLWAEMTLMEQQIQKQIARQRAMEAEQQRKQRQSQMFQGAM